MGGAHLEQLRRAADAVELPFDALDRYIADGTANVIDIGSHYNFSPERLRLFRNGSRVFPQYESVAQFSDEPDHYRLQPDAGDTMTVESASRAVYVVNYLMEFSAAFALSQSLTDGDVFRWGAWNDDDGWYIEQRGADHSDTQVDVIELSGGTTTTLFEDAELPKPLTGWYRYESAVGWYAVLNQAWQQTHTTDGDVTTDTFVKTSNDGDRGPETGNLKLRLQVEADASTPGLEVEVGSMSMITLGDPTELDRSKQQFVETTVSGTDGAWEPIYAIRIDPSDPNVQATLSQLDILDYAAADDIELVAVVFDPSKTNATEWGQPDYHHAPNSAMQATENVSQVADASGTVTDFGTTDKFGGYTIASAVDVDGGRASGSSATINEARRELNTINTSDEIVILARTSTTESDIQFVWDAEQNW